MVTVWGRNNSINVQKVMWTVAEIGLDHERHDKGGPYGGLDDPGFLAMNPNARIPVLQDGGLVLWESNATVRYLAACYDEGGLWDADPAKRALSDRWMDWQATTLNPPMFTLFMNLIRLPEPQRDPKAASAAAKALEPLWAILDERLADAPYVAGDRLTIGDVPLGCAAWRWSAMPFERPDLPNLAAWLERLKERPAFEAHVMAPVLS
ncbi:MAG: glutathione S-transferase [Geminicoccaceae bacterium]|nr:glutathione S-transferase [Geminicoccaceae bacterium]